MATPIVVVCVGGGGGGDDDASSYVVDNLEQGLIQGLIDPFKFSRIPVLPIVMYRARSSSILNCFIGKEQDNKVNSLLTETMLLSYISSIGDHKLLKSLIKNISYQILNVIKTPSNILNILIGRIYLKILIGMIQEILYH